MTFADLLESADVRLYKTARSNAAKDISYLACDAATEDAAALAKRLSGIIRWFMDDLPFEVNLGRDMYKSNEGILHILMEMGEAWAIASGGKGHSVQELMSYMRTKPTIEHVFAQSPTFEFPSRGFGTREDYFRVNNCLGNLCVLEKDINSRCQDKTSEQKLQEPNLYKQSQFDVTKALVAEVAACGGSFVAASVDERTRRMVAFVKERWCQG